MSSMAELTKKQEAVRDYIASQLADGRPCPSRREIAKHFRFASSNAAASHVRALLRKGVLIAEAGKARALRLAENFKAVRRPVIVEIPLYGSIPAGFADGREQETDEFVRVDVHTIGFKPTRNTFALKVKGDSMIGRHICSGDIVVLEHGVDPLDGEIVAALIDRKDTLKTFISKNGKMYLKSENPKFPNVFPSEELMIQGVFRGLIRKAKE